ncbi:hypothetical protein BH23BAC4_BH23BAC4_06170 [soil metagenome]
MRTAWLLPLLVLIAACDSASPPAPQELSLDLLMAPVTGAEVSAVVADWQRRDTAARDVRVEGTSNVTLGSVPMTATVYSHDVGGVRHIGVVLVPTALTQPASAPVLIYAKGGYTGPGGFAAPPIEEVATRLPGEPLRSQLVYVIPAYRSERISVGGTVYTAGGSISLGDYDVDDTMALLSVALQHVPQADPSRVAIVGESRGALVALAMGARDPRVDLVVDAFGPSDFRIAFGALDNATFLASVRAALAAPDDPANLITSALLPLDALTAQPDGSVMITAEGLQRLRLTLARTAPRAYVARLPRTEVHHGTGDTVASVEFSRALRDAFVAAGRPSGSGSFTYYEYPGGQHDVTTLPGYFTRVAGALTQVFGL